MNAWGTQTREGDDPSESRERLQKPPTYLNLMLYATRPGEWDVDKKMERQFVPCSTCYSI